MWQMNCKSILETEASLIINFKEQVLSILHKCDKNSICTIMNWKVSTDTNRKTTGNGFKSGLKM